MKMCNCEMYVDESVHETDRYDEVVFSVLCEKHSKLRKEGNIRFWRVE